MTNKKLHKIAEKKSELYSIKIDTSPKEDVQKFSGAEDDNYVISLSNRSNDVLEFYCFNYDPKKGFGQFRPIPSTGNNCTLLNCTDCYDNEMYSPILVISCKEPYFNLTLITRPDASGNAKGSTFGIDPTCDFGGGVICYV